MWNFMQGKCFRVLREECSEWDICQLRKSIINYMKSPDFKPAITLDESIIRHLYENEAQKVDMFTNDSPDELKPKVK